jgi:hypothetical protein
VRKHGVFPQAFDPGPVVVSVDCRDEKRFSQRPQ